MQLYFRWNRGLIFLLLLAVFGGYPTAQGFQNYFNSPNSQITSPGRLYFQQQINSTLNFFEADTDVVYGLGSQTEVGLAVNDLEVYFNPGGDAQGVVPTSGLVFGIQKKVQISKSVGLAFGTKNGIALNNNRVGHWVSRGHFQGTLEIPELRNLYASCGVYYLNGAFIDRDDLFVGIMAGVEYPLVPQKLHLIADLLSGDHVQGAVVLGGAYWFSQAGNVSLGLQIPWPGSPNKPSLIFELTLL